ncbi:uncharacterized protein MELLADRAFT_87055 [Melampsora larici-populina 98AG31]|uniref:Uncharacterized protein n=1 Tax=Melampsora larici-populina (strain 98AG31 / pathotype 3-4-7) TaxID=747676 RepID=F4R4D0_MELLP|nr:uncharacterized protein MELLADRAFT_87055 [Melampsora larici-populina 98AG31]EGG13025.1 hypothetical protein MELLADRAFT_87055 [Melampsora larici-populina 98AG31]
MSQSHPTATSSATEQPQTSTIPVPEVGRTFPDREPALAYLRQHAHENNYAVTTCDKRPTFTSFKCYLGPTRAQKKMLADAIKLNTTPLPIIPTCPFETTARRDQKTHQFVVEVGNPTHDHPPSVERIPIEAYSRRRITPATTPPQSGPSQLLPQANTSIPNIQSLSISSQPSNSNQSLLITSSSQTNNSNPYISHLYTTLFTRMQTLPAHSQTCLLTRFLSECQLAEALTANPTSSIIDHSTPQIRRNVIHQEKENEHENQMDLDQEKENEHENQMDLDLNPSDNLTVEGSSKSIKVIENLAEDECSPSTKKAPNQEETVKAKEKQSEVHSTPKETVKGKEKQSDAHSSRHSSPLSNLSADESSNLVMSQLKHAAASSSGSQLPSPCTKIIKNPQSVEISPCITRKSSRTHPKAEDKEDPWGYTDCLRDVRLGKKTQKGKTSFKNLKPPHPPVQKRKMLRLGFPDLEISQMPATKAISLYPACSKRSS